MSNTIHDTSRVIRNGDRSGERLGTELAGIIVGHMQAMEAGYADGYERDRYVVNQCPMPERFTYVPDRFARVPVLFDAYVREFALGQLAYRADHLAAYGSCPLPV